MQFRIAFSVALAFVAWAGRIAAAGEIDHAVVVKVADQAVVEVAPRLQPRLIVRPQSYPYPMACESVVFPRSPLCAGRPAFYYAPYYPWYRWVY